MNLDLIIASKIFTRFCLKCSEKSRLSCHEPIYLVKKEEQDFNDKSGAKVIEGSDGITIYVNRNNKYLESVLKREPEDRKQYYETAFKNAVGLQTLALYNQLKDNGDSYEQASSAIAATMIAVIKETDREICNY